MTDWSDQITEFQRLCMEQQQQLLSGWFGTLQKAGTGTPQNVWHQAVDSLEQQVNGTLDAQQQSFKALIETIDQAGLSSPEAAQWQVHAEAGMSTWINVQHQLWKTWFDMLRKTTPAKQEPGEMLMQNWQDFMQRTTAMQEQWLSSWTGGQQESKKPKKQST